MAPTRGFRVHFWMTTLALVVLPILAEDNFQCAVEYGIRYKGDHFFKINAEDPGQCCSICQQRPLCQAWSYIWADAVRRYKPKACWLFDSSEKVDEAEENLMSISGIRDQTKSVKSNHEFVEKLDFKDKNLYNVWMNTANDCGDFCAKKLLCKAAVYDKKKKKCFGKRGTSSKSTHKDCTTAVM